MSFGVWLGKRIQITRYGKARKDGLVSLDWVCKIFVRCFCEYQSLAQPLEGPSEHLLPLARLWYAAASRFASAAGSFASLCHLASPWLAARPAKQQEVSIADVIPAWNIVPAWKLRCEGSERRKEGG